MPEHRSPEALRTWLESLIAQVDHCEKEAQAFAAVISLRCSDAALTPERIGLAYDLTQIAAHHLSAAQSHLLATRKVLTDTPD